MPLTVHFLNVGEGDCTIVEFPSGRLMVIDMNNGKTLDKTTREAVRAQYRSTRQTEQARDFFRRLADIALEHQFIQSLNDKLTDPIAYLDHWFPCRDIWRLVISHPDMDHMTGLYRLVNQANRRIHNLWHSGPADFNLTTWEDNPRFDKRETGNVTRPCALASRSVPMRFDATQATLESIGLTTV